MEFAGFERWTFRFEIGDDISTRLTIDERDD